MKLVEGLSEICNCRVFAKRVGFCPCAQRWSRSIFKPRSKRPSAHLNVPIQGSRIECDCGRFTCGDCHCGLDRRVGGREGFDVSDRVSASWRTIRLYTKVIKSVGQKVRQGDCERDCCGST